MKTMLLVLLTGFFVAAVYWAYDVNYETRAIESDIRQLKQAIKREKATTKVLQTEWSYLNRPERLSALAEKHFVELGLAPMNAEHFGVAGMVAYPLQPDALISDTVDAASRSEENEDKDTQP